MLPPRFLSTPNPRSGPGPSSTSSSSGHAQGGQALVHPDDAVRGTDDDAASSRLSAVSLRYLDDPFASLLHKPRSNPFSPSWQLGAPSSSSSPFPAGESSTGTGTSRKPPLINLGTHHRTWGIDLLVDRFLESGGRQVVSLGAGSDTRFWRLMSRPNPPRLARYIEIDFPHLTSPKAQRIARSRKLYSLLTPAGPSATIPPDARAAVHGGGGGVSYAISKGGTELVSPLYALLPLDLRSNPSSSAPRTTSQASSDAADSAGSGPAIPTSTSTPTSDSDTGSIPSKLSSALLPHLDPALPTLFIAECLFCYMPPEDSEAIIRWFGETFKDCMGLIYEMCGLDDAFGGVMRRNLAARHLSIPGSSPFPTPQSQAERFLSPALSAGTGTGTFDQAGAKTLWEIRQEVICPDELKRISKLELLDEIEELRLVLSHYVIVWGTKGAALQGITL